MSNILPILKNRSEFEVQKSRGMFVEVIAEGLSNENTPFVIYGEDMGAYMQYCPSEDTETDKKTKDLALENLKNLGVDISIEDNDGIKMAFVEHEYAAEMILDEEFLSRLCTELGNKTIAVGIPMKGVMVAAEFGSAKEIGYMTSAGYEQSPTYPISKDVYCVVNGKVSGIGAIK